jgi:3-hydroxybutyryl-CoA dehydrogenase
MNTSPLHVTVVGSGYMGKGIAHTLARGGALITLADREPAIAAAALEAMIEDVRLAEERGLVAAGSVDVVRERSTAGASIESAVAGADVVVEAVFEDIAIKHEVLKLIEESTGDDTVITTNTSAIPVSDLATVLRRPERFFGVHWFNPAPYLPAIEIIVGEKSDESLLAPVTDLLVASGKAPVTVADTPGFICNRLQFALFKEAALMVEEGIATPDRIDGVVRSSFGFRLPFFGPFAIADMAGLDVYANSYTTLEAQLGPRFTCPPSLRERVDSGDLGIKTGGGYLGMTADESSAMTERRDRSYIALAALRDSLESSTD